jgi:hypothetical protein
MRYQHTAHISATAVSTVLALPRCCSWRFRALRRSIAAFYEHSMRLPSGMLEKILRHKLPLTQVAVRATADRHVCAMKLDNPLARLALSSCPPSNSTPASVSRCRLNRIPVGSDLHCRKELGLHRTAASSRLGWLAAWARSLRT